MLTPISEKHIPSKGLCHVIIDVQWYPYRRGRGLRMWLIVKVAIKYLP